MTKYFPLPSSGVSDGGSGASVSRPICETAGGIVGENVPPFMDAIMIARTADDDDVTGIVLPSDPSAIFQ
ncbi:hypothetical protein D3C76_1330900 [compost metagenome]